MKQNASLMIACGCPAGSRGPIQYCRLNRDVLRSMSCSCSRSPRVLSIEYGFGVMRARPHASIILQNTTLCAAPRCALKHGHFAFWKHWTHGIGESAPRMTSGGASLAPAINSSRVICGTCCGMFSTSERLQRCATPCGPSP